MNRSFPGPRAGHQNPLDEGPSKLFAAEIQIIRTAADALLFDGDAYDELAAVEDLAQQLVDADRGCPTTPAVSSTTSPPAARRPACADLIF